MAAFLVAGLVDRLQHLFAKLAGIGQDVVDQIGRQILELGKIAMFFHFQEFMDEKAIILDRRAIDRHTGNPLVSCFLRFGAEIEKRSKRVGVGATRIAPRWCPIFVSSPAVVAVWRPLASLCDAPWRSVFLSSLATIAWLAPTRGR